MSSIPFDHGRFWVDDHPYEPGNYLVCFNLKDKEIKKWARGMKLKPFLDQPGDGIPDQWMVVCDKAMVVAFKLAWG